MRWPLTIAALIGVGLPAQPRAQRFAAIGDYGTAGQPARDVAQLVHSWQPDFIITLGDNNYPYGDSTTIDQNIGQYYHAYLHPYRGQYGAGAAENRFFPSLGNHDLHTAAGKPYHKYFTLPGNERYYDFVRGNVHFVVLNSNRAEPDGIDSTSRQAQWCRQVLGSSTAPWRVVYFHHAPYCSGQHEARDLRWPFKQWGASVVLTGHNHLYERLEVGGLTYIVNGLGGTPQRFRFRVLPIRGSRVRYRRNYGALLADATATRLQLQFITRRGHVIDTFSLTRP
ncbi:metallophosphoesterase family protein [Solirubrum puertoriconensis]|uniref:Calcineurin-like phosphoesterase domain-containing protein n=1 Tax=Solirubrum puertoriconensis TaxID=1751427 RepID=A0A9X0HJE6_SOLP1|nr:metallophosphoesterase [Solirubrum puertoriconensis]KUG07007.1 hypothetical protein ASU33_06725 [Solirubrum puertoriconensis]